MKSTPIKERAIGVFDSGVGGLTVVKQLIHLLPHENIIYFGDTARVPYGNKSQETILRYSLENVAFLMKQEIKLLVIACHTAAAQAGNMLKQHFTVPTVDVVESSIGDVATTTQSGRIAILGTKGTISSGIHQQKLQMLIPHAKIFPIACPLWVHLAEEKFIAHPASRMIVQEYLAPLQKHSIDTVLLACTHYPLLQKLIAEELGKDVAIVNPAETCAEKVMHLLDSQGISRSSSILGCHQYFVSDDPARFCEVGEEFLEMPLKDVQRVLI
jgi:glutamate racemase